MLPHALSTNNTAPIFSGAAHLPAGKVLAIRLTLRFEARIMPLEVIEHSLFPYRPFLRCEVVGLDLSRGVRIYNLR